MTTHSFEGPWAPPPTRTPHLAVVLERTRPLVLPSALGAEAVGVTPSRAPTSAMPADVSPPPNFDPALGCWATPKGFKRCGKTNLFRKGLCQRHYKHLDEYGDFRPIRARREGRDRGGRSQEFRAHGHSWPTKTAIRALARAAKEADKSVAEFIVDSVVERLKEQGYLPKSSDEAAREG